MIGTRVLFADGLGNVGEIELDGTDAARFEVDEFWSVRGAQHVAGMRLTVKQLLGSTPVSSTAATITASTNDTLAVTLDGVSTTVTIAAGTYTASALAGAVQTAINSASAFATLGKSVTVSQALDVLTITSNQLGASSAVSVTGGTAKTNLLGAAPTTTTTVGQVYGTQPGSYALTVSTLPTQGKSVGSDKSTQAVQTGSAAANLSITTGANDQFNVAVDGGAAVLVTLTQGLPYASATALATEVQTRINAALTAAGQATKSVSVAADATGKISITSNAFGATSAVSVTAQGINTGNTDLLGVAPASSTIATITAGVNDTLALTLGDTTATVTLTAGSYTASALATQIQSAINGTSAFITAGKTVSVTQALDVLTITATSYGSTSTASMTATTARTNLFGTPTATTGVDAAGTINGAAALGSGQFLTGVTGNAAEGLKVQIIGGLTGARGTVDYSQGYAYSLNKLLGNFLASAGSIASRTDGINKSITDIDLQRKTISRRLAATEALYRKQFSGLDTLVANMNTTSNSLSSMLASLPSSSNTQSSR